MPLKLFARKQQDPVTDSASALCRASADRTYAPADPQTLDDDPVTRYLQMERFGHIARHQARWADPFKAETDKGFGGSSPDSWGDLDSDQPLPFDHSDSPFKIEEEEGAR